MVSNGVYHADYNGGAGIVVDRAIEVRSANGPESTFVEGSIGGSCSGPLTVFRGFTIQDGGIVRGFTIRKSAQGAYLEGGVLEQCIVTENDTRSGNACGGGGGGAGVGIVNGTMRNCLVIRNHSGSGLNGAPLGSGGGVLMVTGSIINCTIAYNNSTPGVHGPEPQGGGLYADAGSVINTIIFGNTASGPANDNYVAGSALFDHSCASPLPAGAGNIASDPQFLDPDFDDFRLGHLSPCVDAASSGPTNDLVGTARPADGNLDGFTDWDMGAYERQCGSVADLKTSLAVLTEPIQLGSNFVIITTISNRGPDSATAAVAKLLVPTGLVVAALSPSQGVWSNQAGLIRGQIGSLASGALATATIVVYAVAAGPFSNGLTAYAHSCDTQSANNAASAITHVTPPVSDLAIGKCVSDSGPGINSIFSYFITVTNNGPEPAFGFSVTDAVPPQVSIQAIVASTGQFSAAGNVVTFSHGFFSAGGRAQLEIIASVNTNFVITNRRIDLVFRRRRAFEQHSSGGVKSA